jgi:bla regulator protein BlaR1
MFHPAPILAFLVTLLTATGGPALDQIDFAARFKGYDGCFVIQPLDGQWTLRHNDARCALRLSPCSTSKIFNSLAALEAKVVTGPDEKFKWDGTKQNRKVCEQDHNMITAIRDSVVWYFQITASRVGEKRMQQYLDAAEYGNRDMSGGLTRFWLQSSLEISADEQVRFLRKLYTDKLEFLSEVMATVRKLIVLEKGKDWTFSGKTGTGGNNGKMTLGWFVGHVESHGRQYVFAANIRAEDGALGMKAKEITKSILKDLHLID